MFLYYIYGTLKGDSKPKKRKRETSFDKVLKNRFKQVKLKDLDLTKFN